MRNLKRMLQRAGIPFEAGKQRPEIFSFDQDMTIYRVYIPDRLNRQIVVEQPGSGDGLLRCVFGENHFRILSAPEAFKLIQRCFELGVIHGAKTKRSETG